jgi:septal ring-binding cell division protein DamX
MRKRMAERRSPGLTFGQLITLTFGFLLASVVIFVFGMWVGRDLADQQAAKQRDVARVPVAPPGPEPTRPLVVAAATRAPAVAVPIAVATRPAVAVMTNTPVRVATATGVIAVRIAATATRGRTVVATPPAATTPPAGGYSVQAYASNDMMKAVMLSRTLKSKGYAASTASKQVRGVTWYVVQVGHYRDRAAAQAVETKLRTEEGLEAASVIAQ